jgi:hypothetical protein
MRGPVKMSGDYLAAILVSHFESTDIAARNSIPDIKMPKKDILLQEKLESFFFAIENNSRIAQISNLQRFHRVHLNISALPSASG